MSRPLFPLKKILVSTDGSENADRAVRAAIELAKQSEASLIILSVVIESIPQSYSPIGINIPPDFSRYFELAEQEGKKIVDTAVDGAKKESINVEGRVLTTMTSVVESVVEEASKKQIDLIVVGTRGLGGFRKLVLGSVSSGIVAHAKCAVLVVR